MWITGTGSSFESSTSATFVGMQQGLSQLWVDDGAQATIKGNLVIGSANTDGTRTYAGPANRVRVADRATMTVAGETQVGAHSFSNQLEVANGAQVTLNSLSTSYATHDNLKGRIHPFANVVRVTGAYSVLILNGALKLGRSADSYGDALEILDGALVSFSNSGPEYNIGEELGSTGHRLLIDGGILVAQRPNVHLGKYGDGNTLTVTNNGVITFDSGVGFMHVGLYSASNTFEVAAGGTVNMNTQFRLGWYNRQDGTKPGGNRLWIHGAGARFMNNADFRFDRFDGQLGNQMLVEDGGYFESRNPIQLPYTQTVGGFSSNLLIRVSGEGSKFVVTNGAEFVLGYNNAANTTNVNATVYVADGGEFRMFNGLFFLGRGRSASEPATVCERNGLHVGPGGRFVQEYAAASGNTSPFFRIGHEYTARGNYARVEGELEVINTGIQYAALFCVGYNGASSRVEVVNGGRATLSQSGLTIGAGVPATDCLVTVGTNSVLNVTNVEYCAVGNNGARAHLVVDGGRMEALGVLRLVVGAQYGGSNAVFEVKNGGVANLTRLVLSDKTMGCSAIVDDATLNLVDHDGVPSGGYLDIGYSAYEEGAVDPRNATLTIRGRHAKVNVDRNIRMRNATAQIRFVVPAEGFAETPFVCKGGFETVNAGASIHV
ncbi:MAG TPA: hypothetical protein P5026_07490 [Kiritimatiellia bacterium]|nr:hypothetical protein [Kiritimatiellia bacterium]HRU69677.1 hypothetical protein [Kiritimatiellia bacterium]